MHQPTPETRKNMDNRVLSLESTLLRKRKPHRKSRSGCRNCKLRRVKCDETQPACHNCIGQFVRCNYESRSTSSKASASSTEIRDDDLTFSISETNLANDALVTDLNRMVRSQYPRTWGSSRYRALGKPDIDRLHRWHTQTVFTMGPDLMSRCYQLTVSKHATQYPYLLHATLALATMQDGYSKLLAGTGCSETSRQIYHYHSQCATALFNERLSKPAFKTTDRNAIWTTACLLGNISSLSMESSDPEMSWPLSPTADSSFDWVNMHKGMAVFYNLCAPHEQGGIFHDLRHYPAYNVLKDKWAVDNRDGAEGILSGFANLCGLNPASNHENCPYHLSLRLLTQIWYVESTPHAAFRFLVFISLMTPDMKALLMQKDARAMMILAYWYTKIFHVHYWLHQRAVIECAAICIYLERYYYWDPQIMDMLQYPLSKLAEFNIRHPALELSADPVEHSVEFDYDTDISRSKLMPFVRGC